MSDLFGQWWEEHWLGMPAFRQENQTPWRTLEVDFRSKTDRDAFEGLVGKVYHGKWLWYPAQEWGGTGNLRWSSPPVCPKYPVYVISKGRWETRHTVRYLENMGVPHRVIVEPCERDRYAEVMDPAKLLVLDEDTGGMKGATPARNFAWNHAISVGATHHWCLDDNIQGFYRLHENTKIQLETGAALTAVEDWMDRYNNVAVVGLQYESFATRRSKHPTLTLNTRVYSCMLIRNNVPFRFRNAFNDDTDFSLRVLKAGWATAIFYAFLANKVATQTVAGGLTDTLYKIEDARLKGSTWLAEQHPDVARVVFKWNRWHHHVDYEPFRRNDPGLRSDFQLPSDPEFGMYIRKLGEGAS